MTATLVSGSTPVAGKTVTFSTTSGTLSPATAVTDANGEATVALIAPNSTTNTTATVTAAYLNSSGTDIVSFTGWNKANIQYWGSLSPASTSCGSTVSFTMLLKNISATTSMTPNTGATSPSTTHQPAALISGIPEFRRDALGRRYTDARVRLSSKLWRRRRGGHIVVVPCQDIFSTLNSRPRRAGSF